MTTKRAYEHTIPAPTMRKRLPYQVVIGAVSLAAGLAAAVWATRETPAQAALSGSFEQTRSRPE